jgi:glycosyltransferase involved in cell wall biosynthesis
MKLLILSNNLDRASFRQRMGIYLPQLKAEGAACIVEKFPKGYFARWRLLAMAGEFDAVLLHKKTLNFWDAKILRKHARKIIYDFDDAIMYSAKKPESNETSHFRLFRRTAKLADMIIAGNSYLAGIAQNFNCNVKILPTGLDTKIYKTVIRPENDGKIRLVWIGSKTTLNYLAEIKAVLEEIGARFENVVLRIISDQFFDLENMEVEKCQWSLEQEVLDLISSDIGLAPLPDNRFTRGKCGFKILQYEAAGLPVVASPVGVNCEYVNEDLTGYLASGNQQWVDKIGRLIENGKLRKQMGKAGRVFVERLGSDVIGNRLCSLIKECIAGRKIDTEKTENILCHKNNPKVSICIPTYNRREYLKETLDSVLSQTYKNYEIVIVDDGSTDGTEETVKRLGIPVTYYWQKNAGDAAARNKLIELARGEYISFIDSDDLLMPDSIARMVNAIEAENEDVIVYGSYYRIDQNGKVFGKCRRKLYSGNITPYLFQTILVHSCGSMFPKRILTNPIAFDTSLKVCSDYDLWLRLSLKYRFIALAKPTFKRRRHLNNLSGPTFENCLTEFNVLKRFYHERGGDRIVPEKIAMKVLSKERFRAGRCALREELYNDACRLLGESFRQHRRFKPLALWIIAIIAKRLVSH